MVVEIKCSGYEDVVKAIEEDYKYYVVFVDWTTNTVIIQSSGQGDFKQDAELSFVKEHQVIQVKNPGVFEKDGEVFIVKPNREKTRLYAMKLVEVSSDRLTINGEHVQFDFEYARGAIYSLTENDRMGTKRAEQLMIRYGRCIVCRHKLKVAESVLRGIGPICIKYFKKNGGRIVHYEKEQWLHDLNALLEEIQNV